MEPKEALDGSSFRVGDNIDDIEDNIMAESNDFKKLRLTVIVKVFSTQLEHPDLKAYKRMYQILEEITLRLPKLDEFPSEPKEGKIAFHK